MKLNATDQPDQPEIPGEVIARGTNRRCALQADIARGLRIAPSAVAACSARIYEGRFLDVLDVIEARSRVARRGRPKTKQPNNRK